MDYTQALEYIHSRPRMKNTDNHAAMKKLLEYMGNPQDQLKYIHIAGTNGKGSCAAMCANILRTAGYKTGLNISPFVIEFRERIQINGEYIPKEELAHITDMVKMYQEKIASEDKLTLLEFEIVTAIAFYYFASEKCDIVCLEVGLGGLTDCTNIIKDNLVSCIMNISYDHTNVLGNTLSEIAYHKAGIIKPGRPVVTYPAQDESALSTISQVAQDNNSVLIVPDKDKIKTTLTDFMQSELEYNGLKIRQSFTGLHQSYNAAVVIEAMNCLRSYGYHISDRDIVSGIEGTQFPARIEVICRDPLIILDGGHNIDGVTALMNVLKANNLTDMTAIWATLSDKQPEKIIEMMSPYVSRLYAVELPGNKRALTGPQLAEMASHSINEVFAEKEIGTAISRAMDNLTKGGLLVFGSLYLASDAREHLLKFKK